MAHKPRRLTVAVSPAALVALDRIWAWNAQTYGAEHAARYIDLLKKETAKLQSLYFVGKPVPTRPDLSYISIRKSRRGHGHVAVYEVREGLVYIINYYHTAQDWPQKLAKD